MNIELQNQQYTLQINGNPISDQEVAEELARGSTEKGKKAVRTKRVILSNRDYLVLEFILEMKFSSLEEVCERFFKGSPEDKNIVGYWYAKKRLTQLEQAGYLGSTKQFSTSKKLYFSKLKSFMILKNLFLEKTFPRPSGSVDGRTVNHDYLLLKLRLELEKRYQVKGWISDRSLKTITSNISKLGRQYTPDGIYSLPQGSPVAFELEISLKAKSRYQDKIKRYVQWIREHRNDPAAFKTVHYVVTKDAVKKHLDRFTAMYPHLFKIEMATNYFPESVGLK